MTVVAGEDARAGRPTGRRWVRALVWGLTTALAAALVAGAVAGARRAPEALDPALPEGVVQAYLQAVLDHDVARARAHLSEETTARCPAADFRQAWVPASLTASLDRVRVSGDEAEVTVRLRAFAGPGPFGGGGYESTETFTLERRDERGDAADPDAGWALTGDPWPVYGCRGEP